jgi:1,4-alpha-glucan branching enzyme
MAKKVRTNRTQTQIVRLQFQREGAQAVSIAGTFNDWRPDTTPMLALGYGRWVKELMLPPGRYEYLFVVDGEWQSDPAAMEQTPNVYGGLNSVLNVPGSARGTQGTEP